MADGRGARRAIVAACLAFLLAACGETTSTLPSPEAVETAEAVARPVRFEALQAATPERDDEAITVALDGRVFGSGPTGVILAHMRPADQTSWFPFATVLAETGEFTVLTFDFRGYGASGGEKRFDRLDLDLEAAYAYMRDELGRNRIFLVGASMGGTAALVVAARTRVAGVVSISAPDQFPPLDALAAVGRIAAPKLFITAAGDVPAGLSLEALWPAAEEPKERHIYEGEGHGTDLLDGDYGADLEQRLIAFLSVAERDGD